MVYPQPQSIYPGDIEKEVQVRGNYLMMACDVEFCLLHIILYCNPNPENHNRAQEFKGMTMGNKIQVVISDMKKYRNDDYLKYQFYFDGLEEFKVVRNHVAHDKAEFDDEGLNPIKFSFLDTETKDGTPYGKYAAFTDDYITQSLARFGIINHHLTHLWMKYAKEYHSVHSHHPFAHPSTYTFGKDIPD